MKIIAAYLKDFSKYITMAFSFLEYLFLGFRSIDILYYANKIIMQALGDFGFVLYPQGGGI